MKLLTIRNLLILVVILFIANLATWYWFVAKLNLVFDAETFDHIISPIAGLLAFAGVIFALLSSVHQNKISRSQNLRPYFEKQIDSIIERLAKKTYTPQVQTSASREYSAFDFTTYINDLIIMCIEDMEFLEDVEKSKKENSFTSKYMGERSYFDKILILSEFTFGLHNRFQYDNILKLIAEIDESLLLEDERNQLVRRIERELLHNYLSEVRYLRTGIHPPIPILNVDFSSGNPPHYTFKELRDTKFSDHYQLFEVSLKKAGAIK